MIKILGQIEETAAELRKQLSERYADPELITVPRSDLNHLLDVYIDNGMVEKEDEEIVNRLWEICNGPLER